MAVCPTCFRKVDGRHRLYLADVALIEQSWPLVEWFIVDSKSLALSPSDVVEAAREVKFLFDAIVTWVHTPKWEWRSQPLGAGYPTPRSEDISAALDFVYVSLKALNEVDPVSASEWLDRLNSVMPDRLRPVFASIQSC